MSNRRCCPPTQVAQGDFDGSAALLRAIADPHRMTILAMLAATPEAVCVCDFTDALPLNQPTVSHHLRVLRENGLITSSRSGTWVYYRLAASARKRLTNALNHIFSPSRRIAA